MSNRAIVLVPGFGRKMRHQERDRLVDALRHYTDGWRVAQIEADAETAEAGGERLRVSARSGGETRDIDVFEAYWGDLVPDWSGESPLARFLRGFRLLGYWVNLNTWISIFGRSPPRTTFLLLLAALMLLAWWIVVAVFALDALGPDSLPGDLRNIPWLAAAWDWLLARRDALLTETVMAILLLVWGTGFLEKFSNISAYLKAYLRDEPQSGQHAGIRAMTRQRVLALLDQLETNPTVQYDEIYVVGHSLGGVIAVDALAEFGDRNDGVVLFTWGSMLGLMTQQEPLIEAEIAKCYEAPTRLKGWIDIVFAKDMLSSRVPVPRRRTESGGFGEPHARVFAASRSPRLPRGLRIFELAGVHDAYFRCEDAMLMLVGPASALPAPDPGAPEAVQTGAAISR